jgi:MoxR-like ATPase
MTRGTSLSVPDVQLREVLDRIDTMADEPHKEALRLGDTRDGAVYQTNVEIETALKVALITGRPILVVGPPGCGKSSLGPYVARNLGLDFLSYTVTEASEPADLLWSVDHVRRLNDAQQSSLKEDTAYVVPGVLWKAFDPSRHAAGDSDVGTVILIDELDKADATFANSLLVALGSLEFEVPPTNEVVKVAPGRLILTLFTSNGERSLPPAFLRRCVTLQVDFPAAQELVEIASRHWPSWMADEEFSTAVKTLAARLGRTDREVSRPVSTAEFLDLVQALRYFGSTDERWDMVEQLVLLRPHA